MAKFFITLAIISVIAGIQAVEYSKLYETIDLDGILSNDRILNNYVNCFTSKGPCTAEGREFKADIPRGILNACKDCTATQKSIVRKAGKFMRAKKPSHLQRVLDHFDPDGKTTESFYKFLDSDD